MSVKPLLAQQPVTQKGDLPSMALVLIIQALVQQLKEQDARIRALEGP